MLLPSSPASAIKQQPQQQDNGPGSDSYDEQWLYQQRQQDGSGNVRQNVDRKGDKRELCAKGKS